MATTPEVEGDAGEPEGLPCPECNETIYARGGANAKMMLGAHRRAKHGVAGQWARDKQPPQPRGSTRLNVVRDMAASAGTGKRAPTAAQLTTAFGKGYGYLQAWRVARLVDTDPRLDERQRGEMAALLAPTAAEAESVASPFARALAKTKLNQTAGRAIVDNIDIADCLFAILEVERRIGDYRREIRAHEAAVEQGQVRPLVGVAPGDVAPGATAAVPLGAVYIPDTNGYAAASEQLGYLPANAPHTEPGPLGIPLTAEDVYRAAGVPFPTIPADVNTGVSQPIPSPSVEEQAQ